MIPPLDFVCLTDRNEPTVGPWDSTANENQVVLDIDADDLKIPGRDPCVAILAGHFLALEDAARIRAHSGTASMPVAFLHAVGCSLTGKVMTLHDPGETTAFAGAGNIDTLDICELFDGQRLSDGWSTDGNVIPEFANKALGLAIGLLRQLDASSNSRLGSLAFDRCDLTSLASTGEPARFVLEP